MQIGLFGIEPKRRHSSNTLTVAGVPTIGMLDLASVRVGSRTKVRDW